MFTKLFTKTTVTTVLAVRTFVIVFVLCFTGKTFAIVFVYMFDVVLFVFMFVIVIVFGRQNCSRNISDRLQDRPCSASGKTFEFMFVFVYMFDVVVVMFVVIFYTISEQKPGRKSCKIYVSITRTAL